MRANDKNTECGPSKPRLCRLVRCRFFIPHLEQKLTPTNFFRLLASSSTFPGKQSYPTGCLWSLRIWLRVNGVDHRIFGEDELWVGRDPDFNSIAEASFARLKAAEGDRQLYNAYVGKALVTFVVKYARTLFSRFDPQALTTYPIGGSALVAICTNTRWDMKQMALGTFYLMTYGYD